MEIEIITFGQIAEFLKNQRLYFDNIKDTDELTAFLEKSYPNLATMKYKLAVNKAIIQENTVLKNEDIIAIMPPFSGG